MAEAAAEATEHVVLAELDIVEEQLRGIGRMQADLVAIAAALETGQRGVEREQRRALGAGFRIGLGGKHDHAGMLAVGDAGIRSLAYESITARRPATSADRLVVKDWCLPGNPWGAPVHQQKNT